MTQPPTLTPARLIAAIYTAMERARRGTESRSAQPIPVESAEADAADDGGKPEVRALEAENARLRSDFQARVAPWMLACFGPEISADKIERNHRFLEEALELVQANRCTQDEAHQLVDYVFGREVGKPHQEVGGVMVTLAALCLASDLDMHRAGEDELARIWTKVEVIRAKQAAKPKHSPLSIPRTALQPEPKEPQ